MQQSASPAVCSPASPLVRVQCQRWLSWPRSSLRVVDWNIDRGLKRSASVDSMADTKADVFILQEVGINAHRTHRLNIAREIPRNWRMSNSRVIRFQQQSDFWKPRKPSRWRRKSISQRLLEDSAKYGSAPLVNLADNLNQNASKTGLAEALARPAVPTARLAATRARHLLEAAPHRLGLCSRPCAGRRSQSSHIRESL